MFFTILIIIFAIVLVAMKDKKPDRKPQVKVKKIDFGELEAELGKEDAQPVAEPGKEDAPAVPMTTVSVTKPSEPKAALTGPAAGRPAAIKPAKSTVAERKNISTERSEATKRYGSGNGRQDGGMDLSFEGDEKRKLIIYSEIIKPKYDEQ